MMKKNYDPIEFAIEFAWANGCDISTVNRAKNGLKQLREKSKEWATEVHQANNYLNISSEIQSLKELLETPVAWAKINEQGNIYDISLKINIDNKEKLIPLYRLKNNVK